MTRISNAAGAGASSPGTTHNAFNDIDLDVFLELMITELQNQDPLNPLENDQLLAQISQIREVGATDKLTQTLDAVLLGQNVSSATSLIGADVVALTDEGQRVTGNVRRVTISDGQPKLDIAVDTEVKPSATPGDLQPGRYAYDVVWDGPEGQTYGVRVEADTDAFSDFKGSLQINNLPETTGDKRIYRTDRSGAGEPRLIGSLRGAASNMLDTVSDSNRGSEPLTDTPIQVNYARKASVKLKNISEITPPL